jgi:hypothetical protein
MMPANGFGPLLEGKTRNIHGSETWVVNDFAGSPAVESG